MMIVHCHSAGLRATASRLAAVAMLFAPAVSHAATLASTPDAPRTGDGAVAATDRGGAGSSEIVVTGQKLGAGKARATFQLDKQDIADRPLGADITQSLNKVPGVKVTTGDSRGGSFSFELSMRGLNAQQVGLTLDGISTGDARFNGGSPPQRFIESSNIGDIVVSQSAGDIGAPSRFALGGFVDFKTDAPSKTMSAALEAGVGSNSFQRQYFRVDTGEIADGLTAYASMSNQYYDIWAAPKSAHSSKDHYQLKVQKLFDDGAFIKLNVVYNNQFDNDFNIITLPQFKADRHSDQTYDELTGVPSHDAYYAGGFGGRRKDFLAYANSSFELGDAVALAVNPYYQTLHGYSLSYQTSHRQLAGSDPEAVTGYSATGGAVRPTLTTTSDANVYGGPADMRVTPRERVRYGASGELKVHDLLPRNTLRIGAWWEGGTSTETRDFYSIIPSTERLMWQATPSYVQYKRWVSIQTTELYAQDSISILPDVLRVDAGVTWYDIHYRSRSPLEYSARLDFRQKSPVQPKVAVSYKPLQHFEMFGGYAENFSGIPEDAFLGSSALISPGELKPLTTKNLDGGIRYLRNHFAISIDGFHAKLRNIVGIVPVDIAGASDFDIERGNTSTKASNILGQRSDGFDVTGLLDLGWVNLYGTYTYQVAKYASADVGSSAREKLEAVGIIAGTAVRDTPRHSAFSEVEFKPVRSLSVQFNGRYVGPRVGGDIVSSTYQEVAVERIPGYTVFGALVRYALPPTGFLKEATVQLNVDNIFDKAYIASVSSATATTLETGLPGRSIGRYFVGSPRAFTVSLRAKL